jgi:heat-inducible transcriptional repressor
MSEQQDFPNINQRAQELLTRLVQKYISEGQPIGSRVLAENLSVSLSSATIRNVMAELENLGYLHSPHTSAGRVPTAQGYRFYVNSLLASQAFEDLPLKSLQKQLQQNRQAGHNLVQSVSSLLSELTHMAGIITLPKQDQAVLRQVEFLPLSDQRVLVILVFNEHEVQNRIIHTQRAYTQQELVRVANYLNQQYAGTEFATIRQQLLQDMQQDRQHIEKMMEAIVEVADATFSSSVQDDDFILAGQKNLLDLAGQGDVSGLRDLFDAFAEKREILDLLDQCLHASGVQIYIGEESGHAVFGECSVVTAPYQVEGMVAGVLGVIGPTRMPYQKVIPVVDITAKLLSSVLNN